MNVVPSVPTFVGDDDFEHDGDWSDEGLEREPVSSTLVGDDADDDDDDDDDDDHGLERGPKRRRAREAYD